MLVCKAMPKQLDPFRFLLMAIAGWMNQQQENVIEYLEVHRVSASCEKGGLDAIGFVLDWR